MDKIAFLLLPFRALLVVVSTSILHQFYFFLYARRTFNCCIWGLENYSNFSSFLYSNGQWQLLGMKHETKCSFYVHSRNLRNVVQFAKKNLIKLANYMDDVCMMSLASENFNSRLSWPSRIAFQTHLEK